MTMVVCVYRRKRFDLMVDERYSSPLARVFLAFIYSIQRDARRDVPS
jgi:hypothetical protein